MIEGIPVELSESVAEYILDLDLEAVFLSDFGAVSSLAAVMLGLAPHKADCTVLLLLCSFVTMLEWILVVFDAVDAVSPKVVGGSGA
jgi:hypothetical protein